MDLSCFMRSICAILLFDKTSTGYSQTQENERQDLILAQNSLPLVN